MRFLISSLITLLIISVSFSIKAEQHYSYVNQSGSTMSFSVSKTGMIKGEYITALGCGVGKKRPLSGWRNGKAIIFSVNFQECNSVTSWVGHSDDLSEIDTIWTLVRGNKDWDMKLTGISRFNRTKTE